MGLQLLIVLCVYVLIQALEHFLSYLNLRHLARHGSKIPAGFAEFIDAEVLKKMRNYTLCQGRVELLESLLGALLTMLFLFGGLLNWYHNLIVSLQLNFLLAAVLFFLLLSYAETLINIPFNIYKTFYIENKFGFNRQTFGLWLLDLLKSLLLSTILFSLLLSGFFWFIKALPDWWWLASWFFLLLFSVFMLYISPYLIEPLFNKFTPIADQELEQGIRQLMKKVGLTVSRVFTMDASKRSGHSNAYFTGIGHVKRIVLFDTLLEKHPGDEVLAILAHEAGHWKKKHLLKMLVLSQILTLAGLYVAHQLMKSELLPTLFRLDHGSDYAKLLLVAFLGSIVMFPLKPLGNMLSRKHEREADRFAAELGQSPQDMARALARIGRDNLANLHPHPWYATFYYSHPPLVQRVAALQGKNRAANEE